VPFLAVLVCAWSLPAALATMETYALARMQGHPFSLGATVLRESAQWVVYAACTPVVLRLAHRFPLRAPRIATRLGLHFAAGVGLSAISALAATAASRLASSWSAETTHGLSTWQLSVAWFLASLPVSLLSYFAVVGVAHAIAYFREAQGRREDALRLEAQLADARLAALQGRLHPHFLYNTLNAITVLVRDGDITKSTRMLELLSLMLRRILDGALPQIVPLATELTLLRQYLEIEEVRFSDRLTVVFDVEEAAMDAGVPTLIMQPLAENAIRHAVAGTSRPVTLVIAARVQPAAWGAARRDGEGTREEAGAAMLELSVADDGPGLAPGWERRRAERTGLSATALRLATLYGSRGVLETRPGLRSGVTALVRLPLERVDGGAPGGLAPAFGRGVEGRMASSGVGP